MRILIDFTQIPVQKAGVGVYARNLLLELVRADCGHGYYFLVQDDDPELLVTGREHVHCISVPARWSRILPFRFVLEQFYIPYLALKYHIDLIHSLHYSFPILAPGKTVVTICDLTFFLFPELHTIPKRFYFRCFTRLAARLADRLIFISESTRSDFLQRFQVPPERLWTTHMGVEEDFAPATDDLVSQTVLDKYGISRPYILYLGTLEPRKNIPRLLEAFRRIAMSNDGVQLVVAGRKGWYYDDIFSATKQLGLQGRVVFTGFVNEEDKPYLLSSAKVFVYPSLYEGFGIPVLEAMACGVPTVTSNRSSMPEVVGDAVLLVDPTNSDELFAAINRLLSDCQLYSDLQIRGPARAAEFSWSNTARQTLAVYDSVGISSGTGDLTS
jgi:glycosyltransferase involved in cell wall biosynthesis